MSETSSSETNAIPKFKFVLIGDCGVGKTSLFLRIQDNIFRQDRDSTIGIDTCTKRLNVDNKDVQISLWDTAGAERFRTITRNFYRNTQAILLVFSMDDPTTLIYLSKCDQDAKEYAPTAQRFLIGNKMDKKREVSQETVENFAAIHNCELVFLTSAKTGQGIGELLLTIAQRLLVYHKKAEYERENSLFEHSVHVNQGDTEFKSSGKCC